MVSRVQTVAFQGIEAVPVDVQVMVAPGKVGISIVGLPDKAVAESRERVQAALHASGLAMPPKRVTVNLAPADLPKEGSHYDLPIALCLMAALGAIPSDSLQDFMVLGELSLDGTLTQVNGALPAAIGANAMGKGIICPFDSGSEAAWADDEMEILAPRSLIALANHFRGTQVLTRPVAAVAARADNLPDLNEIKGSRNSQTSFGNCRCWWSQYADGRTSRFWQIDVGDAPTWDIAATHTQRIVGSIDGRIDQWQIT